MKRTHLSWGTLLLLIAGLVLWYYLQNAGQNGPPGPPPGPQGPTTPGPAEADHPHLRWGNPSGATADPSNRDNYLMEKPYYALSYNNTKGTPNWVSWRLVAENVGHADREGLTFQPDGGLPAGFKIITHKDYVGSGFDRGHMCPAKDRSSDMDALKATFITTNIVPQSHPNNAGAWERFEDHCRTLAGHGKELYIVAGPYGQGGEGTKGRAAAIADGQVVVPAKTWKVVLVLNHGEAVDADARLIGFVTPNDMAVGEQWEKYACAVRDVEQLTGYHFFDRADPAVIGPLKEKAEAGAVR